MATGKSAVGRELAAALSRRPVDTDDLIVERAGLPIPQIFEHYGEEYFRDLESEVIAGLEQCPPGELVISAGGGAVIREINREHFFRWGVVILLTASTEAILQRVRDKGGRPLLQGEKLRERIELLQARREPYYRRCHLQVDTTGRRPRQVAAEIKRRLFLQ